MPLQNTIIRPDGSSSITGFFPSANLHGILGDNNDSTLTEQNNASAGFTCTFGNLSIASASTITKIVFNVRAAKSKRPTPNASITLRDGSANYPAFTLPSSGYYTGTITTFSSSDYTTQADGSSALTVSYVDGLFFSYIPNGDGQRVYDIWLQVFYNLPTGYSNDIIGLDSSDIDSVKGLDTADIDSINGL
jgi:hypothetical protein